MEIFGGVALLVEDVPEIEFRGQHVHIIDKCGVRRAMPRSVAIQAYALFAQRLREDRLGSEARAKLAVAALGAAKVIKLKQK